MPSKAISYIRFSSSIQKQGDSLRRQTELIENWLLHNPKINLSDIQYKDLGLSGYHGDHLEHGFGKLLAAIKNSYINAGDYLLVEDIDRLGRMEATKLLPLLLEILAAGVIIETLGDGQTYTKESMNSAQLYILVGKIQGAHSHSDKLSKRIKASWVTKRKNAEEGKGVNRKSYWYITEDDEGKFTRITPQNKALVTKIFVMFQSGVSQNKIVQFLKENDPVRFKTYSPTALKKLLLNKTAIGYWDDIPNVYEPVIEEQLFYSVQNIFKERAEKSGGYKKGEGAKKGVAQGRKSNHIMAGLVVCKRCGKNYSVKNQKNHSAPIMYCSNPNKENCDNRKTIPIAILNEFRMRTQEAYIKKILDSKIDNDNQKLVVALDGQIDTKSKSIENLIDLVVSGSSFAAEKVTKLEAELKQLKLERVGLVQTETSTANIENLKMAGLDMSKDPLILNAMLKQVGYKIAAEVKTMYLDNDQMEYITYVKPKKCPLREENNKQIIAAMANDPDWDPKSISPKGKYRVSFNGVTEDIVIPNDDKLTLEEKAHEYTGVFDEQASELDAVFDELKREFSGK